MKLPAIVKETPVPAASNLPELLIVNAPPTSKTLSFVALSSVKIPPIERPVVSVPFTTIFPVPVPFIVIVLSVELLASNVRLLNVHISPPSTLLVPKVLAASTDIAKVPPVSVMVPQELPPL